MRRSILYATTFIIHMYNNTAYRLMDSFMPTFATKSDVTEFEVGVIFASFCLPIFAFSPAWSFVCNRIGYKYIILAGLLIESIALCLLACCGLFTGASFIVYTCIFRFLEGFGSAGSQTGCYAMLASENGEDAGAGFGTMEMLGGAGQMLGPILGGFLFSYGVEVPFVTIGACGFCMFASTLFIMPSKKKIVEEIDLDFINQHTNRTANERYSSSRSNLEPSIRAYIGSVAQSPASQYAERKVSVADVLKVPSVVFSCVVALSALGTMSFLQPTLEPHLQTQFNLSKVQIGLFFASGSFIQTLMCPVVGRLADQYPTKRIMLVGLFISSVALLLMGPSPLFEFLPEDIGMQIAAITLLGLSTALAVVPTFPDQVNSTTHLGFAAQARVAGLSASVYSLGEVVGPLLGSAIVDAFSFRTASTILGLYCASVFLIGFIVLSFNLLPSVALAPSMLEGESSTTTKGHIVSFNISPHTAPSTGPQGENCTITRDDDSSSSAPPTVERNRAPSISIIISKTVANEDVALLSSASPSYNST